MKKKISAIFLAALMLCSCFAGCDNSDNSSDVGSSNNSNTSSDTGSGDSSGNTDSSGGNKVTVNVTDGEQHLVDESKRTHINNNDYTKMKSFVVNGASQYVIIDGACTEESKAALDYMKKQIAACTGYTPEVYLDADQDKIVDSGDSAGKAIPYSESAKYIVVSHQAMEKDANVTWRTDIDLDYSGYMIKTVGDSVFMKINSHYGYQTVGLAFLREVLGYEWYAEDCIVYTKDGSQMPTFDLIEKPDFDLVWRSGFISSAGQIGSGVTSSRTFTYTSPKSLTSGSNFCHNSFDYLPESKYAEAHKLWYSDIETYRYNQAEQTHDMGINQLCYSAHGNKEEYDLMLQTAFEGVKVTLQSQPKSAALTFTRQDGEGHCTCNTCNAIMNTYYGSHAATYMLFVNDLDTLIQQWLQEEADKNGTEKRDVTVLFFAYSATASAPVGGTSYDNYIVPKADVKYSETQGRDVNVVKNIQDEDVELPYNKTYEDGLKCNENVGCFFAPIDATFEESFYHKENDKHRQTFEKWGLLTDRLYCWVYDTNFVDYLTPYNSFDAIPETIRFLKDAGGQFIFNQAQYENKVCTGFGAIKTFLNYELPRDVNQDTGEMMDRFFKNYFREAAGPMREYYELLVAYMEQLQVLYPDIFYSARRTETDQPEYWDFETMLNWLELCEKAKLSVAKYKASDPELYAMLIKHITIETIFPRWMICNYYDGYYNPAELQTMRQSFVNDCNFLSVSNYAEGDAKKLSSYVWGMSATPNYKLV